MGGGTSGKGNKPGRIQDFRLPGKPRQNPSPSPNKPKKPKKKKKK